MRKATGTEIKRLKNILAVLRKDPDVFPKLKIGTILKEEQFDQSYEDWLRLLSKFDRYHEIEFFKPNWVPICFDEFVFIDVAQENWCIFEAGYNCWEDDVDDHYWYKNHFFIDMEDLLNNVGDYTHLKEVRNRNRDQRQNDVDEWLENLPR